MKNPDKIDFKELAYVFTRLMNAPEDAKEEMLATLLKNVYEAGKKGSGL